MLIFMFQSALGTLHHCFSILQGQVGFSFVEVYKLDTISGLQFTPVVLIMLDYFIYC